MELSTNSKKLLDILDELAHLNALLNRQVGRGDFESAYSIAKTMSIKISSLLEELYIYLLQSGEVR